MSVWVWTKFSKECFQHLVESGPRRINAVLRGKCSSLALVSSLVKWKKKTLFWIQFSCFFGLNDLWQLLTTMYSTDLETIFCLFVCLNVIILRVVASPHVVLPVWPYTVCDIWLELHVRPNSEKSITDSETKCHSKTATNCKLTAQCICGHKVVPNDFSETC